MSKEIVFGKEGKDKPLIIWELPWNALFAIGTGSNMEGWHARSDLNPRPLDSKSTALSTELRARRI